MRPIPQTLIISAVVGLILEFVVGGVISATHPARAVQAVLGLLALGLTAAVGVAWYRRADPAGALSTRLAVALPIPVFFALLTLYSNIHHHTSGARVVGNLLLAVVAIALGVIVGELLRTSARSDVHGYR